MLIIEHARMMVNDGQPEAYKPVAGHRHKHGTTEPGWIEHSHMAGGAPHSHDPDTGMQVPLRARRGR